MINPVARIARMLEAEIWLGDEIRKKGRKNGK